MLEKITIYIIYSNTLQNYLIMESLIIEKETKKMNLWIRTQDRKKLVLIN